MILSPEGLDAITEREGSVPTMYRDQHGFPTIGVGHLLTRDEWSSGQLTGIGVDWHEGLTPDDVELLLAVDSTATERVVTMAVHVPLTQGQFDALCSFVFNVGAAAFLGSTLLTRLNAEDYASVPEQLRRWTKAHDGTKLVVDPILVQRRESEITQWQGATA